MSKKNKKRVLTTAQYLEKLALKRKKYAVLNVLTLCLFPIFRKKKEKYKDLIIKSKVNYAFISSLVDKLYYAKIFDELTLRTLKSLKKLKRNIRNDIEIYVKELEKIDNIESLKNNYIFKEREYPYTKAVPDIDLSPVEDFELPKFNTPLVSIIIPCYNNFMLTMQCIRAIAKYTLDIPYEVIVTDDKSTDEMQYIASHIKNVVFTVNLKENGFVNNCNNGASVARGRYLYFLNNDTQVQEDYLKELLNVIEPDDSIGLVGSMLVNANGTLQEAGGIIFRDTNAWNIGRGTENINEARFNYVRDTDYLSGAAILVRKDLFDSLNGFDQVYSPAYCEDADLCLRIWYQKNKRVVFQPKSRVVHFDGGSFPSEEKQKLIDRNKKTMFERFNYELSKYHSFDTNFNFVVKDHASQKKQALVIDWKILSPSFDTGSRVTFQYMKLLQKMEYNVKYFPMDLYLEKDEFLDDIQQAGIEVVFENLVQYLKLNGKYFDLVFLNRPNIAQRYINLIRLCTRAFVIFHGHDLHYLRRFRENKANNVPNAEEKMLEEKQEELSIYKLMDLSVFVSNSEKEMLQKELPFSHMSTIPIFLLDPIKMKNFVYKAEERQDIAFVAGFAHSPNIDAAVWFVNEILPKVKEKISNIKFYIIGSKPSNEVKALACDDVIVTGYVTDEELENYYSKLRLIVVPLRFGAGVKGKVVEGIYNKVPVVTTAIGAEGIDNTSNIMTIADDVDTFAQKVIDLYLDDIKLQELSDMSEKFIKDHYTEEAGINAIKPFINN